MAGTIRIENININETPGLDILTEVFNEIDRLLLEIKQEIELNGNNCDTGFLDDQIRTQLDRLHLDDSARAALEELLLFSAVIDAIELCGNAGPGKYDLKNIPEILKEYGLENRDISFVIELMCVFNDRNYMNYVLKNIKLAREIGFTDEDVLQIYSERNYTFFKEVDFNAFRDIENPMGFYREIDKAIAAKDYYITGLTWNNVLQAFNNLYIIPGLNPEECADILREAMKDDSPWKEPIIHFGALLPKLNKFAEPTGAELLRYFLEYLADETIEINDKQNIIRNMTVLLDENNGMNIIDTLKKLELIDPQIIFEIIKSKELLLSDVNDISPFNEFVQELAKAKQIFEQYKIAKLFSGDIAQGTNELLLYIIRNHNEYNFSVNNIMNCIGSNSMYILAKHSGLDRDEIVRSGMLYQSRDDASSWFENLKFGRILRKGQPVSSLDAFLPEDLLPFQYYQEAVYQGRKERGMDLTLGENGVFIYSFSDFVTGTQRDKYESLKEKLGLNDLALGIMQSSFAEEWARSGMDFREGTWDLMMILFIELLETIETTQFTRGEEEISTEELVRLLNTREIDRGCGYTQIVKALMHNMLVDNFYSGSFPEYVKKCSEEIVFAGLKDVRNGGISNETLNKHYEDIENLRILREKQESNTLTPEDRIALNRLEAKLHTILNDAWKILTALDKGEIPYNQNTEGFIQAAGQMMSEEDSDRFLSEYYRLCEKNKWEIFDKDWYNNTVLPAAGRYEQRLLAEKNLAAKNVLNELQAGLKINDFVQAARAINNFDKFISSAETPILKMLREEAIRELNDEAMIKRRQEEEIFVSPAMRSYILSFGIDPNIDPAILRAIADRLMLGKTAY